MHQTAVYAAIWRALTRLLPDLAKTPEGRSKIETMVHEIMKEISDDNIRFVTVRDD